VEKTRSKLTVILHADIVGSTNLVQQDEELAHVRIREMFQRITDAIQTHFGQVLEVRGDALVAEFNRASDAVLAAVSAQEQNATWIAALEDNIRPLMRIGIAMGEVVVADDTVTGEGVVLAQRLEQIADAGSVCVQGTVFDTVPSRTSVTFHDIGEQNLKGFDRKVRAYSVVAGRSDSTAAASKSGAGKSTSGLPWLRYLVVATSLTVVAFLVFRFWETDQTNSPSSAEDAEVSTGTTTDNPATDSQRSLGDFSIAVLPFENMSEGSNREFFGPGIAEDIITDLSRLDSLTVIARQSSFKFSGSSTPIKDIGRQLRVRYVLAGSVREAGDALRINAKLIDTISETNVWADRYDGNLSDVFSLQDDITQNVVQSLKIVLSPTDERELADKETSSADAYALVLQGSEALHHARRIGGMDANINARDAFEKALKLDPDYSRAYAGLAWAYWNDLTYGFGMSPGDNNEDETTVWELVEKSIALRDNALARRLLIRRYVRIEGTMLKRLDASNYDAAIDMAHMGVQLEPGNAAAMADLATVLVYAGETDAASKYIRQAIERNPNYPLWYRLPAGAAAFLRGNYELAVRELSVLHEVDWQDWGGLWMASALGHLGRVEEGKKTWGAVAGEGYTVGANLFAVNGLIQMRNQDKKEIFLKGLSLAGMPDYPKPSN